MRINICERDYRKIECDSYSSIATFINDKKEYYYRYVKKYKEQGSNTKFTRYGSLVDCLLFTPEEFDNKFVINKVDPPKAQMLAYTEEVFKLYKQSYQEAIDRDLVDNSGIVLFQKQFTEIYKEAYNNLKYDVNGKEVAFKRDKEQTIIDNFNNNCIDYFNQLVDADSKILVELDDYNRAERAVNILKTHKYTKDIINRVTDDQYEVIDQCIIKFHSEHGVELKCMIDRIIIDHYSKTVEIYDLKTSSNIETFSDSYLKYKYYIQGAVYNEGVTNYMKDRKLNDYYIEPIKFIVQDSYNYLSPLIYETNKDQLIDSITGFIDKNGIYYTGLRDTIRDMEYCKLHNEYRVSPINDMNNGKAKLIY